jgi:hypothetical protein
VPIYTWNDNTKVEFKETKHEGINSNAWDSFLLLVFVDTIINHRIQQKAGKDTDQMRICHLAKKYPGNMSHAWPVELK